MSSASAPDARRAGHYLGLHFAGRRARRPAGAARGRQRSCMVRGTTMRVMPHLWNTDADVERLFAVCARR